MKHYVLANDRANLAKTGPEVPERLKYIDVILSDERALASAEIVVEFYHALNSLVEDFLLRGQSPGVRKKHRRRTSLLGGSYRNFLGRPGKQLGRCRSAQKLDLASS